MRDLEVVDGITVRSGFDDLFEEKYRPSTIKECILPAKDKKVFMSLLKDKSVPHILLHSEMPGTGKTTAARALCEELGIDYRFYNGSNVTIDVVRNEFPLFAKTAPTFGAKHDKKVIILDEFDRRELRGSQEVLRSFMNTHGKNCRIIITGNNITGIIDPIIERCRNIPFGAPSESELKTMRRDMYNRMTKICDMEGITYDKKALATLVLERCPNMRSITSAIQLYAQRNENHIDVGILTLSVPGDSRVVDDMIDALKTKDMKTIMEQSHTFAASYSTNILILQDKLYKQLTPQSIMEMISITGENNSHIGMCGHEVVHTRALFRDLLPLTFKE